MYNGLEIITKCIIIFNPFNNDLEFFKDRRKKTTNSFKTLENVRFSYMFESIK